MDVNKIYNMPNSNLLAKYCKARSYHEQKYWLKCDNNGSVFGFVTEEEIKLIEDEEK